jgi:ABC-type ATPase involved in cell division
MQSNRIQAHEIDRIVKEAAASGATIVVASHEIERAQQLATRTISLVAGQVRDSQ